MYECSSQLDQLKKAFIAVKSELVNPSKDSDAGRYRYLSLGAIQDLVYPVCHKHGLCLEQWVYSDDCGHYRVLTSLFHVESGQWEKASIVVEPEMNVSPFTTDRDGNKKSVNNGIQQMGGSITYWQRYALRTLFGLTGADDDNDGIDSTATYSRNVSNTQREKETFVKWISPYQHKEIKDLIGSDIYIADIIKKHYSVNYMNQIPSTKYSEALAMVKKIREESL